MIKKLPNPLTLFRSKSINYKIDSPPKYITKQSIPIRPNFKITRRMSQRSFVQHAQTHVSILMHAKIVFHFKDNTCICTINGNCPINTIAYTFFNELQDYEKSLNSCYLDFTLGHTLFNDQFYSGKHTILGRPFIEKYIECMDYDRRIVLLKDDTRLDIFNEIPINTISICIGNEHFLAIVDVNRVTSIISLEILEKMENYDTTCLTLSLDCTIPIEHSDYPFTLVFRVIDNRHKYIILGLDFMKNNVFRVGKNYLQLKNGMRVHYLKK